MQNDGLIFLVWVRGSRGPEPQLWNELWYGVDGQHKARVIRAVKLPEEHVGLPLDDLARLHPPEEAIAA